MSANTNIRSAVRASNVPTRAARILVVDDEPNVRSPLRIMLSDAGHAVLDAPDARRACELIATKPFDLVLTDLRMGQTSGIEVLRFVKETSPETQVILMSGDLKLEDEAIARRLGAHAFLDKPFAEADLKRAVDSALAKVGAEPRVVPAPEQIPNRYVFDSVVGSSAPLRELIGRALRAAPTDSTVLITGESGTGKELIAKGIHAMSKRSQKPFISVNCAALNDNLLESELFGHVRGAFTGASSARRGLFEEAHTGTLFLDEIGESTLSFQAKLLRAIQEREIVHLGATQPIKVDVRIIAATNQSLLEAAKARRFRFDLYYRLNVVTLALPPLRQRREDIALLVEYFLNKFNRKMGKRVRLGDGVLDRLRDYRFDGNVRELENMIEHGVALDDDGILHEEDIPAEPAVAAATAPDLRTLAQKLDEFETREIEAALRTAEGNKERAARALGLEVTVLARKMKRLRIGTVDNAAAA
jgi:two-component system, NtrC family, response regulator HydG